MRSSSLARDVAEGVRCLRSWLFRNVRKAVVAVVGLTILSIGVAMIVLPGPAILVIPLGLGVLALEFAWAERVLRRVKEEGRRRVGRRRSN
jgi:tellurite resistance protein TerC